MLELNKIVIITEDSDIQPIGHKFELEPLSIDIPKSYTVWLSNFNNEFSNLIASGEIIVRSSLENIITSIDSNNNISTSNETIYQTTGIQLLFENSIQTIETCKLEFIYNDTVLFDIEFEQTYIDLQDRLYIAANNYGIQINEDWNQSFIETDIHEDNPDMITHNRKLSEFMMHAFELIGLRGTYKTFMMAIKYFGYDNILRFEETWIDDNDIRHLTDINNQIVDEEYSKYGYYKIGDLTMFYSLDHLDEVEPYDEGGLPQYEYRNISFKDLYSKLVTFKHVLQKYFLPYDVKIVDIIGEFHVVAGLQKKIIISNDHFLTMDIHSKFDFMDIVWDGIQVDENGNNFIYISEQKFIANTNLFTIQSDETLSLNSTVSAHPNSSLIIIDRVGEELESENLEDFDILTKFFVQDIGILNQIITLHTDTIPEYIFGFKLRLNKKNIHGQYEKVYQSGLISPSDVLSIHRLGIRELGNFEISITVFDKYGYSKTWSGVFEIRSEHIILDFINLRPEYITESNSIDHINRLLHFNTVHETGSLTGIPIIDAVDNNQWSINNPNSINESILRIARRYDHPGNPIESPIIKNKRNIMISQLDKIPISENWNPYHISFIRLSPDFEISLKVFEHEDWTTIQYQSDIQFMNELSKLSKMSNSVFSNFDFDIQLLNDVYDTRLQIDERDKSIPVLVMFAKVLDFSINTIMYKFKVDGTIYSNEGIQTQSNIEDVIYHNEIFPSFGYDPMIKFNDIYQYSENDITSTMNKHIIIKIDNTTYTSDIEYDELNFGTLKSILMDMLPESVYEELEIYYSYNTFTIRNKYGKYIEMSHVSIGHKIASHRQGAISKMYKIVSGSEIQIGSMVILIPNEDVKINMKGVKWRITDTYNRIKYLESDNYVCKWTPYRAGLYDVEMIVIDKVTNNEIQKIKRASILVA